MDGTWMLSFSLPNCIFCSLLYNTYLPSSVRVTNRSARLRHGTFSPVMRSTHWDHLCNEIFPLFDASNCSNSFWSSVLQETSFSRRFLSAEACKIVFHFINVIAPVVCLSSLYWIFYDEFYSPYIVQNVALSLSPKT